MILDGNTVYALFGYRPKTKMALKWIQKSDGNWRAIDRGASQDAYFSQITIQATRTELEGLETALDDNRFEFTATFSAGEEIFGADVDHTGNKTIVVTNYGEIQRDSMALWSMPLEVKIVSPTFLSVTGSLSDLTLKSFQTSQFSEFDILKDFTYDQSGFYLDKGRDPGYFIAEFEQTDCQMQAIRRYLTNTNRSGSLTFPTLTGVDTPFGYRMGTGPFSCRIIEWEDLGRKNALDWGLRIKFAREF